MKDSRILGGYKEGNHNVTLKKGKYLCMGRCRPVPGLFFLENFWDNILKEEERKSIYKSQENKMVIKRENMDFSTANSVKSI